jgi:catechol 2,3-dioxygenase-like lactoylglutathione lyase family enzyme
MCSITGFRHVGIVVRNLERCLPFYRDLLGLKVWSDFTDDSAYLAELTLVPEARVRMVKLSAPDGASVELLQYLSHPEREPSVPPRPPSNALGCSHLALQVDDLDALHSRLKSNGIEFHCPPRVSPDGGAKVTYCRDPEGVIVELVEVIKRRHLQSR